MVRSGEVRHVFGQCHFGCIDILHFAIGSIRRSKQLPGGDGGGNRHEHAYVVVLALPVNSPTRQLVSDLREAVSHGSRNLPLVRDVHSRKSAELFARHSQDHDFAFSADGRERRVKDATALAVNGLVEGHEERAAILENVLERASNNLFFGLATVNAYVHEATRAFGERISEASHRGGDAEYPNC